MGRLPLHRIKLPQRRCQLLQACWMCSCCQVQRSNASFQCFRALPAVIAPIWADALPGWQLMLCNLPLILEFCSFLPAGHAEPSVGPVIPRFLAADCGLSCFVGVCLYDSHNLSPGYHSCNTAMDARGKDPAHASKMYRIAGLTSVMDGSDGNRQVTCVITSTAECTGNKHINFLRLRVFMYRI